MMPHAQSDRSRRYAPSVFALVTGGAWLGAAMACSTGPSRTDHRQQSAAERPTESFRLHHAEIREHLGHIDAMAESLPGQSPTARAETMRRVVGFLQEHIAPHAADEERILYPVVERLAGQGSRLTAVPIHEHRIVERWIGALEHEAAKPAPDAVAFATGALHLTGLLHAHFEIEEEVLLPVLDRTMTRAQFQRDVADKMPR